MMESKEAALGSGLNRPPVAAESRAPIRASHIECTASSGIDVVNVLARLPLMRWALGRTESSIRSGTALQTGVDA